MLRPRMGVNNCTPPARLVCQDTARRGLRARNRRRACSPGRLLHASGQRVGPRIPGQLPPGHLDGRRPSVAGRGIGWARVGMWAEAGRSSSPWANETPAGGNGLLRPLLLALWPCSAPVVFRQRTDRVQRARTGWGRGCWTPAVTDPSSLRIRSTACTRPPARQTAFSPASFSQGCGAAGLSYSRARSLVVGAVGPFSQLYTHAAGARPHGGTRRVVPQGPFVSLVVSMGRDD